MGADMWTEQDQKQKDQRVMASDAAMAERHRGFDLSAQDNHSKFERAKFAVVGEGTRAAYGAYREGWERIFGKDKADRGPATSGQDISSQESRESQTSK